MGESRLEQIISLSLGEIQAALRLVYWSFRYQLQQQARRILVAPIDLMDNGFPEADVLRNVLKSTVTGYPCRHIRGGDILSDPVILLEQAAGRSSLHSTLLHTW